MITHMSGDVQRAKGALEMDVDGSAPTGALTASDGRRSEFSGWSELAAVIEDWRGQYAPTCAPTTGGCEREAEGQNNVEVQGGSPMRSAQMTRKLLADGPPATKEGAADETAIG